MRWAETTRASWGTPKSVRIWAAAFMVSQSLEDPMTMPTTGEALFKAAGSDGQKPDFRLPTVVVAVSASLPACFPPPSRHDRHHPAELRGRTDPGLDDPARAAGHLGALVRPVQGARPDAREARDRIRRSLHPGQAQCRRGPRDRRPAQPDVRRALDSLLRHVLAGPAGGRLRRRHPRGADQ